MSLVDHLVRRASLVWLSSCALALAGAGLALRLPSGIYPELDFPRVVVVARSGDAPPELTQVSLTRPLEAALATVLGVERLRSRTIRGAAELALTFAPGTDMWRALQLVEARVSEARASLPLGTQLTVERLNTTSFPVLTFNLTGDVDPRRLRELAELELRPALSRVRGVGRVEVLGGDVREVEVILDPERVAALHLGPKAVAQQVVAQTGLAAVGRYEAAHASMTVMASAEPENLEALRALPVAVGPDGSPVPLGAIAEVREGAEDRLLRVSARGGETVLLSVARLPGASTPEVARGARAAAEAIQRPPGVQLSAVYDQSELVSASIRSVGEAIGLGVLLCVGVIALFLRDLRGGLIAALSIPFALGATFLPMAALGESLDLMTLGGLAVAIGLVIDDGIVVVDGITRGLERGLSPLAAARAALAALGPALLGTTATTVVVFLPLAWLEGVVGRFFGALAATLGSAVLLSLVAAVTVVPLAAATWLRPPPSAHPAEAQSPPGWYERALGRVALRPLVAVSLAVGLLALGAVGARNVPSGFLPTMDEGAFVLDYFLPAGTSLSDTDAVARRIERVLADEPAVISWSRRTGAELGPATATLVSRGDVMVRLQPKADRALTAEEVIAKVRARLEAEVPEARVEFVQVLQDVLDDLSGTPRPIELKLFGNDYPTLRVAARQVAERVHDVPGLVDLYEGFEGEAPELRLRIDPAAAARAGGSAQALTEDLDAALHGALAGVLRRPDRPINIRVRYPDAVRFDPQQIARLPVALPGGAVAPLSTLATASTVASDTVLLRESLRPVVILTADREGIDLGSLTRELERRLARLPLPPGVRWELGGQAAGQAKSEAELAWVMAWGAVGVGVVLVAQLRRAALAGVVLASVPLALVGAVVALWLTGTPLNASSLMGCVLLVGLTVKNGILLLEHFEAQRAVGHPRDEALRLAAHARARPIAMTTLATLAGLIPLALGLGAGAELLRPLAIAVIGGLTVSSAVSLLLLPSFVRLLPDAPVSPPVDSRSPSAKPS